MRMVADRLSLRWYLSDDLSEPLSDHSSVSRIRERYSLDIFCHFCGQSTMPTARRMNSRPFGGLRPTRDRQTSYWKPKVAPTNPGGKFLRVACLPSPVCPPSWDGRTTNGNGVPGNPTSWRRSNRGARQSKQCSNTRQASSWTNTESHSCTFSCTLDCMSRQGPGALAQKPDLIQTWWVCAIAVQVGTSRSQVATLEYTAALRVE
jgi:hypothetical protein